MGRVDIPTFCTADHGTKLYPALQGEFAFGSLSSTTYQSKDVKTTMKRPESVSETEEVVVPWDMEIKQDCAISRMKTGPK